MEKVLTSLIKDKHHLGDSRVADYTYSEFVQSMPLKYTLEPTPFLTERHGENFSYDIPLEENGKYTLVLQFVEVRSPFVKRSKLYFTSPGDRIFNIQLGDQIVR
jgi:hypothetical protein